jgi:hypothetical protein
MIYLRQFVERTTGEDDAEEASKWWVGGGMLVRQVFETQAASEQSHSTQPEWEGGVKVGSN